MSRDEIFDGVLAAVNRLTGDFNHVALDSELRGCVPLNEPHEQADFCETLCDLFDDCNLTVDSETLRQWTTVCDAVDWIEAWQVRRRGSAATA